MKFDKFMNVCYRVLAILTTCAVVVGLCFSCFAPIHAHAELSASDMAQIEKYLETYASNQATIDFRFTDENGRSARLQIASLQQLYYNQMESLYLSEGFDYSTAPDTFSVSGSGYNGLYYDSNGNICPAVVYYYSNGNYKPGSYPLCSMNGQSINLTVTTDSDYFTLSNYRTGTNPHTLIIGAPSGSISWAFSGVSVNYYYSRLNGFTCNYKYGSNTIPTPNLNNLCRNTSTNNTVTSMDWICGIGSDISLPSDSVDTVSPWDYYNNTLLPYIKDNFDIDNIDDYLVFPNGYNPPTDPIEPSNQNPTIVAPIIPVIIGSGNIINVDGVNFDVFAPIKGQLTIDGINFQFPIDELFKVNINGVPYDLPTGNLTFNGHTFNLTDQNHLTFDGVEFIINADGTLSIDGTTFNYPIGEPETMPVSAGDFVYKYEIPTLENINIVDASLQSPDLSNYATGIDWIWESVTKILTDSGLLPVVIISLSISALGYALWKIGG